MRGAVVRTDGVALQPGDWLDIGTGIGKFSGAWENPTLGLMCSLNFFRRFDSPQECGPLFIPMRGPVKSDDPLHRAVKVRGPLRGDGKRPKPLPQPPALTVVVGGKK